MTGRVCGSHAEEPASPQKGAGRKQAQAFREIRVIKFVAGINSDFLPLSPDGFGFPGGWFLMGHKLIKLVATAYQTDKYLA